MIGRVMSKGWNYFRRAVNVWDVAVIGDGQKVLNDTFKQGLNGHRKVYTKDFYQNLWKTTKQAGKNLEAYKAQEIAKNGSTWKSLVNSFRRIPQDFKSGWTGAVTKTGAKAGFFGKLAGACKKGLGGKGTLFGALLLAAFEIPNIVRATKDQGLGQGALEAAKGAAKLGGFTLGSAIGAALLAPIPGGSIIGMIVGGLAGDWLVSKIVGKSYSEKKAEEEEKMQNTLAYMMGCEQAYNAANRDPQVIAQQFRNPFAAQQTMTPAQIAQMQQMFGRNSFGDDFMSNAYKGVNYMA